MKPSVVRRMVESVKSAGLPIRSVEFPEDGLVRVNVGASDDAVAALAGAETSADLRKLL